MYIYIAIIRSQKELFDGKTNCSYHSVADPGFSRRGEVFTDFFGRKLHENERI